MRVPTYDEIVRRLIPDVEFHQNRYVRELEQETTAGCRWLDLGAGKTLHRGWGGPSPADLAARAGSLVGCDLLAGHMRANRQLTARVVADAAQLPFADASFDLVSANMVLEHLPDPARAFSEVARILAPGGRFAFVTPNRRHPAVWFLHAFVAPQWRRMIAERWERRACEDVFPTRYEANTSRQLRRLADETGLGVARLEVFRSYPMFRRPAPVVALECLWIKLQAWRPLRQLGSNLVGCLAKPPVGR